MVRLVSCLVVALSAPLDAAQSASTKPSLRFPFDADFSGVAGVITFQWDSPKYSGAKVTADLKFDKMDFKALRDFDGNCTGPVKEYTWHIHTEWNMPPGRLSTSAGLKGCAKAITGNHYDPYKICGPASEYVDTPTCATKAKEYNCSPDEYKRNFAACEAGDLSGKFGKFKPDSKGVVKAEWYDQRFHELNLDRTSSKYANTSTYPGSFAICARDSYCTTDATSDKALKRANASNVDDASKLPAFRRQNKCQANPGPGRRARRGLSV